MTRITTNEDQELHSYNSRNSLILPSFFFFLFYLLSCTSVPKTPDISLDTHLPLEPGAYVYLIAEQEAMPVLNQLMFSNIDGINNKQFQQMIDLTRFAAAAVYVAPNGETGKLSSRYRLAAWGSYPASRAKVALGSNKEWKKQRSAVSKADYWYSAQRGLSLAVTGEMALVATAPDTLIDPYSAAPGTPLPEGFAAFREGSVLSCWLNNPGPAINQKLLVMGIPIEIPAEQFFISLVPAEEQRAAAQRYVARLQIQVPDASQARALTVVFAFARNFLPPQLSANLPVQDGKNLNIATAPLTAGEIALLLKMFSL